MRKNKKALTPLMVTFLLVTFAVAVGAVVMNAGSAEVEDQAQCPVEIGLQLAVIGGEPDVCYDAAKKQILLTIENGVNIKVDGFVVNIIGQEKSESYDQSEVVLSKAGSYFGKYDYDKAAAGEIRQVKITPKIMLNEIEEVCAEQALIIEDVLDC